MHGWGIAQRIQADSRRRPARAAGVALWLAAPPHPRGLDHVGLARHRSGPAGALLQADPGRPQPARRGNRHWTRLSRGVALIVDADLLSVRYGLRGTPWHPEGPGVSAPGLVGARGWSASSTRSFASTSRWTRGSSRPGLDPGGGRRRSAPQFGVVSRERQRARDSWGLRHCSTCWRRHARGPAAAAAAAAYTLLGVGTLALGDRRHGGAVERGARPAGAPLPVADDARLQIFWSDYNWTGVEFDFVEERQRAFPGWPPSPTRAIRCGSMARAPRWWPRWPRPSSSTSSARRR